MQIEDITKSPNMTGFENIPISYPFWFDGKLCIRFDEIVLAFGGTRRNYLNLATGYTGFIDPKSSTLVQLVEAKVCYSK